jgi:nitric-oxide synthase
VLLDNPLIQGSTKLFLQVDIVDFNGSFLTRVRDLIGANPIILVATKVDLLPKGTSLEAVADWLTQATLARKLNVISIHLTSAKAATGISGVASVIQRQRQVCQQCRGDSIPSTS